MIRLRGLARTLPHSAWRRRQRFCTVGGAGKEDVVNMAELYAADDAAYEPEFVERPVSHTGEVFTMDAGESLLGVDSLSDAELMSLDVNPIYLSAQLVVLSAE